MNLDGRVITIDQIKPILDGMQFVGAFRPKFIEIHNTSSPDIALYNSWMATKKLTPEQWLQNLASYYSGLGWNSMPHAFVLPDGRIGLGAPFNIRGTHSPSWNGIAIGIETVGEFERETFAGTPTERALVALTGELHNRLGLMPDQYIKGVRGIHFHKEDLASTHRTCPGKNLEKPRFVSQVLTYMGDAHAAQETDKEQHVDIPVAVQTAQSGALTQEQLTSPLWLQQRLVAHGAKLRVDGLIGQKTKDAVEAFQAAHPPLKADGIAGPLTRMALAA